MHKNILSLGAGVQSSALYLMAMEGEIPPFDCAIFSDVQEEPAAVYEHLEWLKGRGGPEIITVTAGRLGDALAASPPPGDGEAVSSRRYVSIPCYALHADGKKGMVTRQCTKDFKVIPFERAVRSIVFGLPKWGRLQPGDSVTQCMGLSYDEPKRVIRIKQRFLGKPACWSVSCPLFDLEMTRGDCEKYLATRVPHVVPRSACVFCPFKTNAEWDLLKSGDPVGWQRAIEVDLLLRSQSSSGAERYLHKSCLPITQVDFRPADTISGQKHLISGFQDECEGYCGN